MSDQYDLLKELLDSRYSCRAFKPDPVPVGTIEKVVQAATRAPSWCNAQPWQVVVTTGDETARFREALESVAMATPPSPDFDWPAGYPGVYGERRRTCGYQLYEAVGIARDDKAARAEQSRRNYAFFDAPHIAILHSEAELGAYGALDSGGFVMAFTLAAQALGLATIAQASVAAWPGVIRQHFGLADNRMILCGISFGYEDPDHPANRFRTERAALPEILDLRG